MNESSSNGLLGPGKTEAPINPPERRVEADSVSAPEAPRPPTGARAPQAGQRQESWRERVGRRFARRPVLRMLALNPVFAFVVISALVGVLLFGVSLPKIWRISPDGFRPVVRCSLLDLAQAWSLARQGRRHWEAGNYPAAARAYFSAAKNKLTDVALLRRALQAFVRTNPHPPKHLFRRAGDTSRWLLQLSATNRDDVFLVAQVYDAMNEPGNVWALLQPREDELPEQLHGAMAKAAFDLSEVEAFARWWQRSGDTLIQDPVLELYHAAWRTGWGPVEEQAAYFKKLRAALARLDQRQVAGHLLLKVYRQRQDVIQYRRTLKQLESFNGDRIQDHVEYWLLLKELGRSREALRLAERYPYPPRNAIQVAAWGEVLNELGGGNFAQRLLERYGPTLGDGPAVVTLPLWALLTDIYIATHAWEDLIRVGRDLRALPHGNTTLSGFGWFAEGRGLVELGHGKAAAQAFENAVQAGFPKATLGLEVARTLLELGYPAPARELLLSWEEALKNEVQYWQLVFRAANQLRDDEALLFKAARQAFALEPDDPQNQLNYAVALLIERQRPEVAIKLTLDYLIDHPSAVARLNHAQALALLGRGNEAQAVLNEVPPPLGSKSRTDRALVGLEVSLSRKDGQSARAAVRQIDERFLFPSQRRWLEAVRKQLESSGAPAAS